MIGRGYRGSVPWPGGRRSEMRTILGNLQNGRGGPIGGAGIPTYQPAHENRATGRLNALVGIPGWLTATVSGPPAKLLGEMPPAIGPGPCPPRLSAGPRSKNPDGVAVGVGGWRGAVG